MAFVDVTTGFGGFAKEYMTYLREECPKASVLTFGAAPSEVLRDTGVLTPLQNISAVGASAMCVHRPAT
jgi:hypothetical protein